MTATHHHIVRILALMLTLLLGSSCYVPLSPSGLACSETQQCPEGQTCGPGQICRAPGSHEGVDAGKADTPEGECKSESCPGPCGEWNCDSGTCRVKEDQCTQKQTCNPSTFQCDENQACVAGQIDETPCGACGRKICQSDGSWGACEAYSTCETGQTCEEDGGSYQCQWNKICDADTYSESGCGSCGRKRCIQDNTTNHYGSCEGDVGLCPNTTSYTCSAQSSNNYSCSATGCSAGQYQSCGDCGRRYCVSSTGQYSATCQPTNSACTTSGESCEASGSNYTCQATGCTVGTYTPCGDCGRHYCSALTGNYSNTCTKINSACTATGETCEASGSNYTCQDTSCTVGTYTPCGTCGRHYCSALTGDYSTTCTKINSMCSSTQTCQAAGSNYSCSNVF